MLLIPPELLVQIRGSGHGAGMIETLTFKYSASQHELKLNIVRFFKI